MDNLRYYSLFLVIALSISCGKMQSNLSQEMITVFGVAKNSKEGAVVVTDDSGPIYIDGLEKWDDALLNKRMEVTGELSTETLSEDELKNEQGEWKQGVPGEKKILLHATWKEK